MTTQEEKALAIAGYEGWRVFHGEYGNTYDVYCNDELQDFETIHNLFDLFSSFNGLMAIIFRIADKYDISIDEKLRIIKKDSTDELFRTKINHPIDALQDAILFYYSEKEK